MNERCLKTTHGSHCEHQDLNHPSNGCTISSEGSTSSITVVCCWCAQFRTITIGLKYTPPIKHGKYKPSMSIP